MKIEKNWMKFQDFPFLAKKRISPRSPNWSQMETKCPLSSSLIGQKQLPREATGKRIFQLSVLSLFYKLHVK